MDPGSIVGLIVSGTTLASKAYNWTQSLKTASSEAKAITGDLGVVLEILRRIHNDIKRRTPQASLFPEEVQTLLERSLEQTNIQSAINCASTYTGVTPTVTRRPGSTASNVGHDKTNDQSPSQDMSSKDRDESSLMPAFAEGLDPTYHASDEVITVAAASHTPSLPHSPPRNQLKAPETDPAPDLFMLAFQKSPSGDTPPMTRFKEAVLRGMRHLGTEDYLMAEAVFKTALEEAVQYDIPINGLYVLATKDLAHMALLENKLGKASEIYKSVVEMCETIGAPDDKIVFECLNKLGHIYEKQDKLSEADAVLSKASAGWQRSSKAEDIDDLRAMHEVAFVAAQSENWAEAEKWLHRQLLVTTRLALQPQSNT